jgi:DNA-binding SARP family transcriptional activator
MRVIDRAMTRKLTGMSSGQLQIQVLGHVRAYRAARELVLGPGLQRAMFVALALRSGRVVPRAALISSVWGSDPPTTVSSSLYTYVSRLRRELEPGGSRQAGFAVLVSENDGYQLRVSELEVDANRFAAACRAGRSAFQTGDAGSARTHFDEALGLWQGQALSGVPGPFAEQQRRYLTDLRLDTLAWRAKALLATMSHQEVVPDMTTLVREHPLREDFRGLLMMGLYRCGRAAEALEVFQDGRAVLSAELGTDPGTELRSLFERMLRNDPALDAGAVGSGCPLSHPSRDESPPPTAWSRRPQRKAGTFRGRQREIGVLTRLVRAVGAGTGGLVWVDGEAGIGKTELLTVALAEAETLGCQLYWGTADQLAGRFPLRAVLECLEISAQSADPRRRELITGPAPGSMTSNLITPADPSLRMTDSLVWFVERLCEQTPVVLVMEDLHWADETTVLLMRELARLTSRIPLLLVQTCQETCRTAELDELWQFAHRTGQVISLPPLPSAILAGLVGDLLDAQPGPRLRRLLEDTIGNPGYVRDLVQTLLRDGMIQQDGDVADLAPAMEAAIRSLLASATTRRLRHLCGEVITMLRWLALLGDDFSLADVAVVTGSSVAQLVPLVDAAIVANILVSRDDLLSFRDSLTRQAVYEAMPRPLRVALRRQATETLQRAGLLPNHVPDQPTARPDPEPGS